MIFVCANCEGGAELADRAAEASGEEVRRVGCMNACAQAPVMAVREPGREAYLFGPVSPEAAAETGAFLSLYRAAPRGRIADATGLPVLRHCLIGRIPDL
jgi:predicted metal-binding protein